MAPASTLRWHFVRLSKTWRCCWRQVKALGAILVLRTVAENQNVPEFLRNSCGIQNVPEFLRNSCSIHRILFSTGITLEIPFVSVIIHRFTVPVVTKIAKQSA